MALARSTELPWVEAIEHGRFSQRTKELSPHGGSLASGIYELPPGKTSFPLHVHYVTEEAMFVISGSATIRTNEGRSAVGAGDWVTFPIGGLAHHLINEGTEPCVYLAFSVYQPQDADIVEYPDSKKIGAGIGIDPDRKRFRHLTKDAVDYFLGEEG